MRLDTKMKIDSVCVGGGGGDVRLDTKMKIDSVCVGGGGGDVRLDTKMKIDSGGDGGIERSCTRMIFDDRKRRYQKDI